jgi:hypothetical protein
MGRVTQTIEFPDENRAREAAALFVATYGGHGNPYEGAATVIPPMTPDDSWSIETSRQASAD